MCLFTCRILQHRMRRIHVRVLTTCYCFSVNKDEVLDNEKGTEKELLERDDAEMVGLTAFDCLDA